VPILPDAEERAERPATRDPLTCDFCGGRVPLEIDPERPAWTYPAQRIEWPITAQRLAGLRRRYHRTATALDAVHRNHRTFLSGS
jgi:hypothetical protein